MLPLTLSAGAARILLPLGRRWPEGPDEGVFLTRLEVPPHQFGPMTYGRATTVNAHGDAEHASVSHGLTSSPQWGEGTTGRC